MNAERALALTRYTPIPIGEYFGGGQACYALNEAINFNFLITGMSGSGKTHTIRNLVHALCARGVTVMVLDTQGDLARGDKRLDDSIRHDIMFRYGSGGATINPLRIDTGTATASLQNTVEDCVDLFRVVKGRLGERQAADLRRLIIDCYAHHGIVPTRPESWVLPSPTWREFHDYLRSVLFGQQTGGTLAPQLFARLRDLADAVKLEITSVSDVTPEAVEAALSGSAEPSGQSANADTAPEKEEKGESIGTCRELVELIEERYHKDVLGLLNEAVATVVRGESAFDGDYNKDRLESIEQYVRDMLLSGLFGDEAIKPKPHRANVFDLSGLRDTHKLALIRVLLDRMYHSAVRMAGDHLNPHVPHMVAILDEGKYAVATSRNLLSPVNRIATEGRKYGLGIVCGVQRLGHLNEDLRASFAATLLLHTSRDYWGEAKTIMGLGELELQALAPRGEGFYKFNGQEVRRVHLSH